MTTLKLIPRKLAKHLGIPLRRYIDYTDYTVWRKVKDGYTRDMVNGDYLKTENVAIAINELGIR